MACNAAAVDRVDKAEARLCLGAAVHVGLSEHEIEVGTDCVGKGEGCETANVWFGAAQFRGMCWCGDDGVTVEGGVGTDVGVQNVVGAGRDHPGRVEVAAEALEEDGVSCAIRMGGEEFLLLLRGTNAADGAERCRSALSTRSATAVPGLGHLVTASMGLVEHDLSGTLDVELYSHCDRQLYAAKRLGRNRTMRKRLTRFNPEPQERTA